MEGREDAGSDVASVQQTVAFLRGELAGLAYPSSPAGELYRAIIAALVKVYPEAERSD